MDSLDWQRHPLSIDCISYLLIPLDWALQKLMMERISFDPAQHQQKCSYHSGSVLDTDCQWSAFALLINLPVKLLQDDLPSETMHKGVSTSLDISMSCPEK